MLDIAGVNISTCGLPFANVVFAIGVRALEPERRATGIHCSNHKQHASTAHRFRATGSYGTTIINGTITEWSCRCGCSTHYELLGCCSTLGAESCASAQRCFSKYTAAPSSQSKRLQPRLQPTPPINLCCSTCRCTRAITRHAYAYTPFSDTCPRIKLQRPISKLRAKRCTVPGLTCGSSPTKLHQLRSRSQLAC